MPLPIEELDFSDLSESYRIGLQEVPEAVASIPKGLLTRHDAFWQQCVNGSDALNVTSEGIRILYTKNLRGFRKLIAWLVAGSLALNQEIDSKDIAARDQYQCDLAWLFIFSVHLCLHELTTESFKLFYIALTGQVSINVIVLIFEDARLTRADDSKGYVLDSILTELVMDHIGSMLYKGPALMSPDNLAKDEWAATLHQVTLYAPQLNRLLLDSTCRAIRRKGEQQSIKYYLSLAERKKEARGVKLISPDTAMADAPVASPKKHTTANSSNKLEAVNDAAKDVANSATTAGAEGAHEKAESQSSDESDGTLTCDEEDQEEDDRSSATTDNEDEPDNNDSDAPDDNEDGSENEFEDVTITTKVAFGQVRRSPVEKPSK